MMTVGDRVVLTLRDPKVDPPPQGVEVLIYSWGRVRVAVRGHNEWRCPEQEYRVFYVDEIDWWAKIPREAYPRYGT